MLLGYAFPIASTRVTITHTLANFNPVRTLLCKHAEQINHRNTLSVIIFRCRHNIKTWGTAGLCVFNKMPSSVCRRRNTKSIFPVPLWASRRRKEHACTHNKNFVNITFFLVVEKYRIDTSGNKRYLPTSLLPLSIGRYI